MSWHKDEDASQNSRDKRELPGGISFGFFIKAGLFFISASSITFEINLTRLFSAVQFYHFAFMIVSTVLLGSAASGIILMFFSEPFMFCGLIVGFLLDNFPEKIGQRVWRESRRIVCGALVGIISPRLVGGRWHGFIVWWIIGSGRDWILDRS